MVADAGTCACHVHVGVPSRDLGVQVLARLRPWLAPLLAVTANSPIAGRHDTGWASWRYPIWSRWPTATPPAACPDAAAYDAAVRRLIGQGAALDERSVYFLARLSPRYLTVEVRVADVCLDTGTAVLLAGLTRALVATALAETRRGTPAAAAPARQVAAALAAAARHGHAGAGADPFTGQPADATALRARLLDHVRPALSDHGDTETITTLLRRLDQRGAGADRQRALFTSAASTPAFITALARATLSGHEPSPRPARHSHRSRNRAKATEPPLDNAASTTASDASPGSLYPTARHSTASAWTVPASPRATTRCSASKRQHTHAQGTSATWSTSAAARYQLIPAPPGAHRAPGHRPAGAPAWHSSAPSADIS